MKIVKEHIQKDLQKYTRLGRKIEADLRHFVVDKEYYLAERWDLFIKLGFGETVYRQKFPHIGDDAQLDLYLEKYETYYVDEILACAIENEIINEHDHKAIDEFREFCLDGFIKEMKWDW